MNTTQQPKMNMKKTPLNQKAMLQWTDFCNALYAAGIIKDSTKAEAFRARALLLKAGRVTQIGRGQYQLNKTGHELLAGV